MHLLCFALTNIVASATGPLLLGSVALLQALPGRAAGPVFQAQHC